MRSTCWCARDGISSGARAKLLPHAEARYAGYVAWRATVPESGLTPASFDALCDSITYNLLPSGHVLVYPIPGLDGVLEPGRRLANLVWYHNYEEGDALDDLMTDRSGRRQPCPFRRERSAPGTWPGRGSSPLPTWRPPSRRSCTSARSRSYR